MDETAEFEVPKPPAPPKPSSSALANAAAAVAAPPPSKTPVQELNEAVGKIDVKNAGKFFNGSCLFKEDYESIKSISCNAKFNNILNYFDYNKDMPKEKFPNLQSIFVKCPQGCLKGEVTGATIHHLESPVCLSAFTDRAIDHNGGIIQILMTKAQDK